MVPCRDWKLVRATKAQGIRSAPSMTPWVAAPLSFHGTAAMHMSHVQEKPVQMLSVSA